MHKILIAEDNELNLKLMSDILETQGFEIDTAPDGEIALDKLTNENFDLLLLDLLMPKLSGFDVLKKINSNNINIKTIVVSACAMNEEIDRAKELGCSTFITKPIRINEFIKTVKESLK